MGFLSGALQFLSDHGSVDRAILYICSRCKDGSHKVIRSTDGCIIIPCEGVGRDISLSVLLIKIPKEITVALCDILTVIITINACHKICQCILCGICHVHIDHQRLVFHTGNHHFLLALTVHQRYRIKIKEIYRFAAA